MNASAIWDLWARVMYYMSNKITLSLFFFELFVFVFFNFWVYFFFSGLCLPNIQPGLCNSQGVFFFTFSLSCSKMFWFDKGNRRSAILFILVFKFGASLVFSWQRPYCTV